MSQDIISYKQKVIQIIDDDIMNAMKSEENLYHIIKALRMGPMTVNELVTKFKEDGIKKSDKSIYRYLKTLIEYKLVARAGKRITSHDEKDLQSETIYIRTSRIFITDNLKHKEEKLGEVKTKKLFELIYAILNRKYPDKITSPEGITKLLHKFDKNKNELIVDLLENSTDTIFQQEAELDWDLVEHFLEYIGWLSLMLEFNVEEEIEKCCPK